LWADEGFGVRVVETLAERFQFPDQVTVMDGGTQGLNLLHYIQQTEALIVFDAIDYGLPAGTLKCIEGSDVPAYLGAKKMSLHQTGFQEVLATADMLGDAPRYLVLIGVQPEILEDYGGSLSDAVKSQIGPAIDIAVAMLAGWGIELTPRQESMRTVNALDLQRYEAERPSAASALRIGDARVVLSDAFTIAPRPSLEDGVSIDVDHRGKY
jgi:hydrogenase maturation protease